MASAGTLNADLVSAKVKTLMNTQLKTILKKESLPVSGAKAAMQTRIINKLYSYGDNNDIEGFSRLRTLVNNPDSDTLGLSPSPSTARMYPSNSVPTPNHYQHSFSSSTRPGPHNMAPNLNGAGTRSPQFKPSPFYSILEPLAPVLDCKAREQTRDTVDLTVNLRADIAERLSADRLTRAMIYSASEPLSPFSKVDIEFPYQLEIKINQDEVKANFRGLKNKPGTTRPVDITTMLRHKPGYDNHMVVTYALTKKKFLIVVNLVRRHPVEELVAKLKSGKTIAKEQVVREMISKSEDAEIVATSSVMSLKCPLSTLRIDIPCRSSVCSHSQCFDASSFLQLQEQAPTWTCPVCNKAAAYEHLQVDQYVADILKSTPKSVDQVTIEPNGTWSQTAGGAPSPRTSNGRTSSDGEEELVEIRDLPRFTSVKAEVFREPGLMRTPPISSREQSTSSAPMPSSSNKRNAGQVVDLTISSDEDDDPPRAPKRQQLVHKSSSGLARIPGLENVSLRANGSMPRHPASNPFATPNHTPTEYSGPR